MIWTHWLMRIPFEIEADLLTLDLPPTSSPKLNAHIQGCPRTMYKRKSRMVRVASYIQQNTESTWHRINLWRSVIYANALCCKERDWEEEANFTASSSQSSFVYTTREVVNSIIKKKGDETSVLKFYLDKTKPLEENGKHPPLTIPFTAMINFIKATSTDSEHVRIVSSEQCHYKSGDIVKVIDGEFEGVVGKVARIAGQQRVVVEISGLCLVATAYIPTDFINIIKWRRKAYCLI